MGVAKWGREDEFKRLFQSQMKRMTRDGLDTLVYIAIKDMSECYKAVPALALHLMKKASNEGSARLNVIRIVDAVISKSRVKHKQTDKFVPRMEAAKMSQALFAQMKECSAEEKSKAAKILQMWRKHNILSPPSQAATEDALGTEMLATSGDSAAVKPGGVSSNVVSASDNDTVADANTKAAAAATAADQTANVTVTSPLATNCKSATPVGNNSSDSGQKGTLGAAQLVPPSATTSATATATFFTSVDVGTSQQADINTDLAQKPPPTRSSSEEMRRSLAQLSQATADMPALPAEVVAALVPPLPDKDGAPPLPPDDVAPFDAGVDAVVLPSGATLTNPQIAVVKPPRQSKFDRPASGREVAAASATVAPLSPVQPPLPPADEPIDDTKVPASTPVAPVSAPAAPTVPSGGVAAALTATLRAASPSSVLDASASARLQISLAAQRERLSLSEVSKSSPVPEATMPPVAPVATGATPATSLATANTVPLTFPLINTAGTFMPSTSAPQASAQSLKSAPPGLPSPSAGVPGLTSPIARSQPLPTSSTVLPRNAWGFESQGFPMRPPGAAPALMMSLPAPSLPNLSNTHASHAPEPPAPGSTTSSALSIPNFQVSAPSSLAAAQPSSAAAAPANAPASIEVLPPPSFGEVWSPAPHAVKAVTPIQAPVTQSGAQPPAAPMSALPPPASSPLPPVGQQHALPQHAQQGVVAAQVYNPLSAASAPQHALQSSLQSMEPQPVQWLAPPSVSTQHTPPAPQPIGHVLQHMNAAPHMPMHPQFPPQAPPSSFPRGPAGHAPAAPPARGHSSTGHPTAGHLPAPAPMHNGNSNSASRAPFQNGSMHGPAPGTNVPYNPFAASMAPSPVQLPHAGAPRQLPMPTVSASAQHPRSPLPRPISLSPPSQQPATVARNIPNAAVVGSSGRTQEKLPRPPETPPSAEEQAAPLGQQQKLPGPPAGSPSPAKASGRNSMQALPPPPPPPPESGGGSAATGQENSINGHVGPPKGDPGSKGAGGEEPSPGGNANAGDGERVAPRKRRRSRWDEAVPE